MHSDVGFPRTHRFGRAARKAARNHEAGFVNHIDHIFRFELAFDVLHTHSKQRSTVFDDSASSTRIDKQRTFHRIAKSDPKLARRNFMRNIGTREQRANWVVGKRAHHGIFGAAAANDERNARRAKHTRARKLGDHAARADDASRIPRRAHDALVDALDALDQVRAFDLRRVRVVEPVDIREDHHKIRLDKARHERRERIVVAEANLLDRHRVVLVHDGHDPHLKQAGKRVARMEIRRAVGSVSPGQKHKGRGNPMLGERTGVACRKRALPHRGRRLKARHIGGPPLNAKRLEPARDGRARHDDGREARLAHASDLARDIVEKRVIDLALRRGKRRRADLNHKRTQMGSKVRLVQPMVFAGTAALARGGIVDFSLVH